MNPRFQIEFRKSNGDLHIRPKGSLGGSSACELVRFLHDRYEGKGRIFIETRDLGVLHPFGCSTFQGRLNRNKVPANRIYFKGEKGFKIAPQGSRVLIMNKERARRCDGRCETGRCGTRRSPILRGIQKSSRQKNFGRYVWKRFTN